MAKKKDSVALFEVIQRSRSGEDMTVPKWMGGEGKPPGAPASTPAPVAAAPSGPSPSGAAERLLAVSGDRLRLSLSTGAAVAACLVLVGLMVGAFALGYWTRGRSAAAPPDGGNGRSLREKAPMGRHVLGQKKTPKGNAGAQTQPGGTVGGKRQQGKWYLVIQSMLGASQQDLQDASEIVAFCKAQGHLATVARYTNPRTSKQRYIVWSLRPFDSPTSQEARAYALGIEKLGQRYKESGGKYNFQQRPTPGAKFDPWFELYR